MRRNPAPALLADRRPVALRRFDRFAWHAQVPLGTRTLHLRSRHFVPHDLDPACPDRRALGLAVASLRLDGDDLRGRGAGWHGAEAGWRWTDGAATLPVSGGGLLSLRAAAAAPGYWVAAAPVTRHQKSVNKK